MTTRAGAPAIGARPVSGDQPLVAPPAGESPEASSARRWIWLLDAAALAVVLLLTWWVGIRTSDFVGQVKGTDAIFHAATVQSLVQSWPHILWDPSWFGGSPSVPGLYPPLYQGIIAAVASASGATIQHAMVECCAASYLVMSASLYGFVRVIAKSRTAAVLAGILVLSVPAFWVTSLQAGEYPRLTGMTFASLGTFLVALYTAKPTRLRFVATILAIGLALNTHPVTGGLGALLVLGVLILVPYKALGERARTAAVAFGFILGLSAWLYLPALVGGARAYYILPQSRLAHYPGQPFRNLIYPSSLYGLSALSPIILPLALLLLVLAAVAAWRQRSKRQAWFTVSLGASAAMMTVVACVLLYAYVGRISSASLSLIGVYPQDVLSYAAWPLAATSGILLASLVPMLRGRLRWWRLPAFASPSIGAVACLLVMTPLMASETINAHTESYTQAPLLPGADGSQQYRNVYTNFDQSSYEFPPVPELGGPFNQGALNLDYVSWAESVLVNPSATAAETEFIDEWNSVRWVEAQKGNTGVYQHNPKAFAYVGPSINPDFQNFVVRRTSPILAVTNTPPALVIGPYADYNLVLRSLALTDVGPGAIIPVEGDSYIDDYSLSELEQFPVVFLYGFNAHNPAVAAKLLADYVKAGGGLVADVAGNAGLATQLTQDGAPLPVTSFVPDQLQGSWNFQRSRSSLTRGIDLSKFSPALYAGNQPYLVEAAHSVAPGSAVVLASGPTPLVVDQRAGSALVVESGVNLPYHDAVFSNAAESALLARFITTAVAGWWYRGQATPGASSVLATDSAQIQIGSAEGVLFKETDSPDWHATLDGHGTTIYPAGLGEMYVRLGPATKMPATLLLRYQLSKTEWASILLSVLTLLGVLFYLVEGRLPHAMRREHRRQLRELLETALHEHDPSGQVAAIRLLDKEALEPYGDILLSFTLVELEPEVREALAVLVETSATKPTSNTDLAALRIWALRVWGSSHRRGAGPSEDSARVLTTR